MNYEILIATTAISALKKHARLKEIKETNGRELGYGKDIAEAAQLFNAAWFMEQQAQKKGIWVERRLPYTLRRALFKQRHHLETPSENARESAPCRNGVDCPLYDETYIPVEDFRLPDDPAELMDKAIYDFATAVKLGFRPDLSTGVAARGTARGTAGCRIIQREKIYFYKVTLPGALLAINTDLTERFQSDSEVNLPAIEWKKLHALHYFQSGSIEAGLKHMGAIPKTAYPMNYRVDAYDPDDTTPWYRSMRDIQEMIKSAGPYTLKFDA